MSKEPLYPHKTPSQLARERGTQPSIKQYPSDTIHVIKEADAYEEERHPALPQGTVLPIMYHEVLARIGGGTIADLVGSVDYLYFPSLKLGVIELIDVNKIHQRKGYGRKLLEYAIDDMKKKGITRVWADVWSYESQQMFSSLGFSLKESKTERALYAIKNI
jgi:GNAT superfamily N-acetyltransferase